MSVHREGKEGVGVVNRFIQLSWSLILFGCGTVTHKMVHKVLKRGL